MEWFLIEMICAKGEAILNAISLPMQIGIEAEAHRSKVHAGIGQPEDDIGMKRLFEHGKLDSRYDNRKYGGSDTNTLLFALVELRSPRLLQVPLLVDRLVNGVGSGIRYWQLFV
jgi:hypothetical protein